MQIKHKYMYVHCNSDVYGVSLRPRCHVKIISNYLLLVKVRSLLVVHASP
jgi:hypothetical protein